MKPLACKARLSAKARALLAKPNAREIIRAMLKAKHAKPTTRPESV